MRRTRSGLTVFLAPATAMAATAIAIPSSAVAAAPYTVFTNVVDSTGPYASFGNPSINDVGGIAFPASLDNGDVGIFRGANPATDTVASSAGPFATTGWDSSPVIGNNGKVAFAANLDIGGYGIFTGGNPATDTLGSTTTAGGTFQHVIGEAMSASGNQVVFNARTSIGSLAHVYRGPNTVSDRVINMDPYSGWATHIDVNDSGMVAFFVGPIYKGTSNATAVIAVDETGPYSGFQTDPAINNGGTVAFLGSLDTGPSGVFKGPDPASDTIANSSGPFSSFFAVDINDAGVVAFAAAKDAGGAGIYVGPDPIADKVIAIGDPLFGSTVTSFGFYRGLNNNGEIAFSYQLANGRQGVAIAGVPVPEPTGLALTAAASMMLLARRRRNAMAQSPFPRRT